MGNNEDQLIVGSSIGRKCLIINFAQGPTGDWNPLVADTFQVAENCWALKSLDNDQIVYASDNGFIGIFDVKRKKSRATLSLPNHEITDVYVDSFNKNLLGLTSSKGLALIKISKDFGQLIKLKFCLQQYCFYNATPLNST